MSRLIKKSSISLPRVSSSDFEHKLIRHKVLMK